MTPHVVVGDRRSVRGQLPPLVERKDIAARCLVTSEEHLRLTAGRGDLVDAPSVLVDDCLPIGSDEPPAVLLGRP